MERYVEPGRWVSDSGLIQYAWPPQGRFVELWARIDAALTDAEKGEAISLLHRWRDETSTLVAISDDGVTWTDVEPDWSVPELWKDDG